MVDVVVVVVLLLLLLFFRSWLGIRLWLRWAVVMVMDRGVSVLLALFPLLALRSVKRKAGSLDELWL